MLALLALVVGGCKRETKTVFQKIDVDAEELLKESALGWFPGELNGRIAAALSANALPVLKEGQTAPSGAQVLRGTLSLQAELSQTRNTTTPEVAVAAVLQLKGKELGALDAVSAHREVALKGAGPEDRREATVHAIEGVLDDIAAEAGALVKASKQMLLEERVRPAELIVAGGQQDLRARQGHERITRIHPQRGE